MTPIKLAVTVALIAASAAMATSKVEFIIQTGGSNNAAAYEGGAWPQYTPGVTDGSTVLAALGDDLNWAVSVLVYGPYNETVPDENLHEDFVNGVAGPGDFAYPLGMANIVFDLVVTDMADNVIQIGHGGGGTPGFHSTINDGDADGARGQGGLNPDPLANAAFTSVYNVDGNAANGGRVIDARTDGGPNLDYWWLPSANGLPAASTAPLGYLIGAGAGYKDFNPTSYVAGVGMYDVLGASGCGSGLVTDLANPQALVEGQIDTSDPAFQANTQYKLKVIATTTGLNILHGEVTCAPPGYGPWGSFATKINQIVGAGAGDVVAETTFTTGDVVQQTAVVGRHLFYNQSFYDGNNAAINAAPVVGANNDDDDAIDPTKSPLLAGGGLAQIGSWTSYQKGINGLMFDIKDAQGTIEQGDFTFVALGRLGTGNTPVAPSAFLVRAGAGAGGSDRVVVTFPAGTSVDGWLQCTIGTGFGLAAPDVCYWGNARGETNTPGAAQLFVNVTDLLGVRDNQKASPVNRPTVDEPYDNNKDGFTNITDLLFVRDNQKAAPTTAVSRITK